MSSSSYISWDADEIKIFQICRRCKLVRLRTEHNGTNISHYQTVRSVARLQFVDGEDSLSEGGGSCDCIERTFADSREWVVFLLASWTTGLTSSRGKKKRTCCNILHRKSDLTGTKQCGLNLCGTNSGQLCVPFITEILFWFNKTGSIYWLAKEDAKEELLNNFCSLKSICDLCLNYYKFFWKWLSLEWEFTGAGKEKSEIRGNRM